MKTIKIFLILTLMSAVIACNPNKDIYETLDKNVVPYSEKINYTFTSKDYTDFAEQIKKKELNEQAALEAADIITFLSFSPDRSFDSYPEATNAFFSAKFLALNEGSSVNVSSKYSQSHNLSIALSTPLTSGFEQYTLQDADYAAMGGNIATNKYLTSADLATLATYIKTIYPSAIADNTIVITFNYNDAVTTYTKETWYSFNGSSWFADATKISLTLDEYKSMGSSFSSGYFTKSYPATLYLPTFLKTKYPYALSKDKKTIMYRFQTAAPNIYLQTHVVTYTFDGTKWSENSMKSDIFLRTATSWVYDLTLRFTMMSADYQILADWTRDNKFNYYNDQYKNEEYYFGASAYYKNFNLKLATRRGKDEDLLIPADDVAAMKYLEAQILEGVIVMLEKKYPTMEPITNGIEQYAEITYMVYYGTNPSPYYKTKFKCVSTGQFEVVPGTTALVQ